jgi:hypothetical protein
MTDEPARERRPDLMGGPEPDKAATDVLEGASPGDSDVMAPPEAGSGGGPGDAPQVRQGARPST